MTGLIGFAVFGFGLVGLIGACVYTICSSTDAIGAIICVSITWIVVGMMLVMMELRG